MEIQTSYKNGQTISDADAVLERFEIALLTLPGEFSPDPSFGLGIGAYIDEQATQANADSLSEAIKYIAETQFPELFIQNISVAFGNSTLYVNIELMVLPANQQRTVNLEFNP